MSGAPFSFEPYPSPGPTAPPPSETRTGDVVVTIVELVALLLGALLVTLMAAIVGLFVEAGDGDSSGLMALVLVPTWGLWLVAVAASVALMSAKKLAFWVPLVAFAVWVVLLIVVTHL